MVLLQLDSSDPAIEPLLRDLADMHQRFALSEVEKFDGVAAIGLDHTLASATCRRDRN